MMKDGVLSVAGRKQHFHRWQALDHLFGELAAVHRTRHDHVGEQKIQRRTLIDELQRFGSIARHQRRVTEALELAGDEVSHEGIVLDDQDSFLSALDRRCRHNFEYLICLARLRQIDLDRRPLPLFAVNLDMSSGLLHESVDHA